MAKNKYSNLFFDIERVEDWINLWAEEEDCQITTIKKTKISGRERYKIVIDDKDITLDFISCKGKAYTIYPSVGKHQDVSAAIAEYIYKRITSIFKDSPFTNGFSIILDRENFDAIIEILASDEDQIIEQNQYLEPSTAQYLMYRIRGVAGDEVVIKYYFNTTRMQVQGKPKMLFHKVVSLASEVNRNLNDTVDAQLRCYSIGATRNDIYEEMENVLGLPLYNYLSTAHKAMLSFAFILAKVDFDTDDYSPIVQQAVRTFEGFAKKIFTECGLHCDGKTQLGYYYTKDGIKPDHAGKISSEKESLLAQIFRFYSDNRHDYMHSSAYDFDARVISDRAVADELLARIINAMKTWYEQYKKIV